MADALAIAMPERTVPTSGSTVAIGAEHRHVAGEGLAQPEERDDLQQREQREGLPEEPDIRLGEVAGDQQEDDHRPDLRDRSP